MTKRPLSKHEVEQTKGAQRPPVVTPRGRSRLRERPGGVAARRRSGSLSRSGQVALKGLSQRLHGVTPVSSLPCTALPMITFITSFELQMHPNVSKNSMWYSNT
ncbi:hypothetical protein Bca101_076770 [Brassica carinata]